MIIYIIVPVELSEYQKNSVNLVNDEDIRISFYIGELWRGTDEQSTGADVEHVPTKRPPKIAKQQERMNRYREDVVPAATRVKEFPQ